MNSATIRTQRGSCAIAVAQRDGHCRTIAARPIAVGDVILQVTGESTTRPVRHSLQVGADEHVAPPASTTMRERLAHYPWAFLDHACEPNAAFRGRELVALQPIVAGAAITFHYATTEWDMAEPFVCRCGSPHCLGEIRGFRHLDAASRIRLRPHVAPHLLQLAAAEPASAPERSSGQAN
jgi:hypothetical protein